MRKIPITPLQADMLVRAQSAIIDATTRAQALVGMICAGHGIANGVAIEVDMKDAAFPVLHVHAALDHSDNDA